MELERDIPFDTPENSVKNIVLILQEEANQLGATFNQTEEQEFPVIKITIDVTQGTCNFRFFVSYADSNHLHDTLGRIGIGFIAVGREENYDLELIPGSWGTLGPPFRWAVSASQGFPPKIQTPYPLDGSLLRQLLRRSLSSLLPESQ